MSLKLTKLSRAIHIIDKDRFPTSVFIQLFNNAMKGIEQSFNALETAVLDIQAAQDAADAATAAATAAQTAADTAQTAADTAQATADSIVIPPTGSQTVTTDITLDASAYTVLVDATAGNVDVTLCPASFAQNTVIVKKIDASANVVTVYPSPGENLNGSGSGEAITAQYQQLLLSSDGLADWFS